MKSNQLSIFDVSSSKAVKRGNSKRVAHGGELSRGKRKSRRPIATKKWMHLVLKSKKATGPYSMLSMTNARNVDQIIVIKAKKFGVELKEFVNMGNHIHFQIRVSSRKSFQSFLRAITCLIARMVTGAKKGKKFGKFWDGLAFSRILTTVGELVRLEGYLLANTIQRRHGAQTERLYLQALNKWMKKLKAHGIRPLPS